MPAFEIICLANSRKLRGRCVAGLRSDGGGWLRPVDPAPEGTLFRPQYTLADGSEAAVLDLIQVDLARPRPEPHHPENWLLGRLPWRLLARPAPGSLLPLLDAALEPGPALLGSTADHMPAAAFAHRPAPASLALVRPALLRWRITLSQRGLRQTRAVFTIAGATYDLPITDPLWERRLGQLNLGLHPRAAAGISPAAEVLLTVSLGEPLGGVCYKLVAAVILPRG